MSTTLRNDDQRQILLARDGEEAVRVAGGERPDLILLAGEVFEVDGYEFCDSLKTDPITAQIRVVMLTALTQESHWYKAVRAGVGESISSDYSVQLLWWRRWR